MSEQSLGRNCRTHRPGSTHFHPALEAVIAATRGAPQRAGHWLHCEIDALAGTPNLLLTYPSALPQAGGHLAKQVKLEFGAVTNQQSNGPHSIEAMQAKTPGLDRQVPATSCSRMSRRHGVTQAAPTR